MHDVDIGKANVGLKIGSCLSLLVLSVAATFFTEFSKSPDGVYPYDTFVLPFAAEFLKLAVSICSMNNESLLSFFHAFKEPRKLAVFAVPALCYILSNNCVPLIILELGPTLHQVLNNLKILSTGILTRVILRRELSWAKWRALWLLMAGSVLAQEPTVSTQVTSKLISGYGYVLGNVFAAGAGSILSEMLLKGRAMKDTVGDIHLQNAKLYLFGTMFGAVTLLSRGKNLTLDIFEGFNIPAYGAVLSMALGGLSTSVILKYIDSIAKCFVMSGSMLTVAIVHAALKNAFVSPLLLVGILLVTAALKSYHD